MGHISFVGKLDGVTLSAGAPAIAPGWTLELMGKHSLDFWLTSEDLPDPENRVTLDREGKIVLAYTPNNGEGHRRLDRQAGEPDAAAAAARSTGTSAIRASSPAISSSASGFRSAGVAHQNGTIRFGHDPGRRRWTELPGARGGQSLRGGRQLLPLERRGESGAHDHGQRAAGRATTSWSGWARGERSTRCRRRPSAVSGGDRAVMAWLERLLARPCSCRDSSSLAPARLRRRSPGQGSGIAGLAAWRRPDRASRRSGRRHGRRRGGGDGGPHGVRHGPVGGVLHPGARLREGRPTTRWPGQRTSSCRVCPAPGCGWCGSGWARSISSSPSTWLRAGRPAPADSRSNDRWFQHVAIIVSDMDRAYARLRQFKVQQASTGAAAAAEDDSERRGDPGVLLPGPRRPSARGAPVSARQGRPQVARAATTGSFSASTTPPSWSATPKRAWRSIATRSASGWPARA